MSFTISITPIALLEIKNVGGKLRVVLEAGGCSGFTYGFTKPESLLDTDHVLDINGMVVAVDINALPFLKGDLVLDYHKTIQETGFFIKNNSLELGKCGCGKSVSFDFGIR
ncbi:Iron-sulfur cluster insertion protein ErpA [Candidatus Xenohaliotis californiensis]|uniref:Iron-sulfur cluster insertion protein ErpA n=1 Tax=Candidatus Xenohaliotis californiensis TaxID=84677 RepID=A0ABP0EVE8_9RICK|nr:Iron-sulfur cluster insertion protein ErpA [Candidatus Xenohaliotis californiensis]